MRTVGIVVDDRDVTVVLVERGEIIWSSVAPAGQNASWNSASDMELGLGALLDRVPVVGWPRPRANVGAAGSLGRVKHVRGLPPVRKRRDLIALLRLSSARFVATPNPVVITGARVLGPGEADVGIVDRALVEAVTNAIQRAGLRVGRVVPTACLTVDAASPECHDECRDEQIPAEQWDTHLATRVATRVATLGSSELLALSWRDNSAIIRSDVSVARLTLAAAILVIAIVVSIAGHVSRAHAAIEHDRLADRRIIAVADTAAAEARELGRISRDLATVASFSSHRVSASLILGGITEALPAEAALTTVRMDTTGVDVVTLSPRTAAVTDALGDVPEITIPSIIGPVSRETIGAHELERATIRMRLLPDRSRGKTTFTIERDDSNE